MRELFKLIAGVPMMFARAVVLDREERAELARIHASSRRWPEQLAPVVQLRARPAPVDDTGLRDRIAQAVHAAMYTDEAARATGWNVPDDKAFAYELTDAALRVRDAELEQAGVEVLDLEDTLSATRDQLHESWSEGTDRGVKLAAVERERAALWNLLKRAVRHYHHEWALASDHDGGQISRLEGAAFLLRAELAQRTRERDAARAAITGVSAPLLQRTVALGKANAEITQLRADVVRLTSELDAIDDAALESAETLKRLREDLADARHQLPGTPGQTVTLHLENGTTTTGRLEIHHNQRTVRGFLADVVGRSVVVVPDGGGSRG